MKQFLLCYVEFKMPIIHILLKHRNSHAMMIYFQVLNNNKRHKGCLPVLLALLLANSPLVDYIAMVSVRFFLTTVVIRR
jgi:hypothetical protein